MLGHEPLKSLRMKAFIEMTRPPNGLMMVFAVFIGYFIQSGRIPSAMEATLASITAYTLTASSMVVNDIRDREIDAVNNPKRPIPSGIVKVSEALPFAVLLGSLGLLSSALLGWGPIALASLFYGLALLYNLHLKRLGLIGNATVSASIAAPYIYGAVLAEGMVGLDVVIIALMSFLSGMGREVVKGISDVKGDESRGVRTFAISHGVEAAARLGVTLVFTAVALSPIPVLIGSMSLLYVPPVAMADAGFIYSSLKLLKAPGTSSRVKREYLLWMFIALIGFLLGAIK